VERTTYAVHQVYNVGVLGSSRSVMVEGVRSGWAASGEVALRKERGGRTR